MTDKDTVTTIGHFYHSREVILCPHSAIGVRVAQDFLDAGEPVVSLGTAHPAKFPNALKKAGISIDEIPNNLREVISKKEVAVQLLSLIHI